VKESSTHGKFTADMAMKTVINKTCKAIINSSSDNALLLETMKRNDELADRASAEAEIEALANTGEVLEIEAEAPTTKEPVNDEPGKEEELPAAETQQEERKEDVKRGPAF